MFDDCENENISTQMAAALGIDVGDMGSQIDAGVAFVGKELQVKPLIGNHSFTFKGI